jgi:hypothetical protein
MQESFRVGYDLAKGLLLALAFALQSRLSE